MTIHFLVSAFEVALNGRRFSKVETTSELVTQLKNKQRSHFGIFRAQSKVSAEMGHTSSEPRNYKASTLLWQNSTVIFTNMCENYIQQAYTLANVCRLRICIDYITSAIVWYHAYVYAIITLTRECEMITLFQVRSHAMRTAQQLAIDGVGVEDLTCAKQVRDTIGTSYMYLWSSTYFPLLLYVSQKNYAQLIMLR